MCSPAHRVADLRCGGVTLNLNMRIALSRHCGADDDFDIPGETNIHKVTTNSIAIGFYSLFLKKTHANRVLNPIRHI